MPSSALGKLDSAQWNRLQEIAERFERAWERLGGLSGEADLDDFLPPPTDPLRLALLHELVKTDLEIRWRRNQLIGVESYLERFPELSDARTIGELLYEEYRVRHLHGDRPDLALYRVRFPEQFHELQARLASGGRKPAEFEDQSGQATAEVPAGAPSTVVNPPENIVSVVAGNLELGGGYRLISCLGRGSFGEVWQAEAPGGIEVAVKIIFRPVDPSKAEREYEALELIKNLRHPLLVQTHFFQAHEDRLVIVMDLADRSLRQRARECQAAGQPGVPVAELLRYFAEAAEALDYLHARHVHHRDVKPDNILLFKRHAKVADFGLAKVLESRGMITATGCGTPPYMAPEIWRGQVSPHSDQYSLACAWVEMRLNRLLFPNKGVAQFMMDHLSAKPNLEPLHAAEQRALLKALAKEPEDRYRNCIDFVIALETALRETGEIELGSAETVLSRPSPLEPEFEDGWLPRPNLPERRRRWEALVMVGVLGLVLAGIIGVLIYAFAWPEPLPEPATDVVLRGHEGPVLSVAFSPDGKRAISGSKDATVRIWELDSAKELLVLEGHTASVHCVAWSPDGRHLASAGVDQAIRLWNAETGKLVRVLHGHSHDVYALAFTPDGRQLLSGGVDTVPRLWNVETGQLIRLFGKGHLNSVNSVAFSHDGKRAVTGGSDKTIRLWNVESGEEVRVIRGHGSFVLGVAISEDGKTILSGSGGDLGPFQTIVHGDDASVRLWDAATGEPLHILASQTPWVRAVAFVPGKKQALFCSGGMLNEAGKPIAAPDNSVCLWDLDSRNEIRRYSGHQDWVWCVAVSPDGRFALSGSYDGDVRLSQLSD